MMIIKILGPGCANCRRLEKLTRASLDAAGVEASLCKVTDAATYIDYGVMATPGLVINEQTVCSGRVPSPSELSKFIAAAQATSG